MTALAQYERLESTGRYFDGQTARPRDVVVKFGDASLIILDMGDMPIAHWSLAGVRDIGDGREDGSLTLTPDYDADERLTIDDPTMVQAIRTVCKDLRQRRPTTPKRWRKVALWTVAALGSVYMIMFHIVPALSDQLATLIPPEAEAAMGEKMVDQFADLLTPGDEPRFCSTPKGDKALAAMTARLEGTANVYLPLTVRVLDHEMVNAFALPGGQIVLFRGLIRTADAPEEVAAVLAHEIGHVVARDPTRLTLRSAGTAGILGLLLGDFTGATVTVALSEALLRSGYQREAETSADHFATALLAAEGLPSEPMAAFFLKLKEMTGDSDPGLLSHLSTHPDLQGRADKAREADTVGGSAFKPVLDDQEWVALRNICQE
ncbi:MAG: M48 family metallopeptidase [Pseudomonadota bacterium]